MNKNYTNRANPLGAILWHGCSLYLLGFQMLVSAQEEWKWGEVFPFPPLPKLSSIAYGNGLFVAVGVEGAIATSTNGREWQARNSGVSHHLREIVFGNGSFVAVGNRTINPGGAFDPNNSFNEGVILSSTDGVQWTARMVRANHALFDVIWANGSFLVSGQLKHSLVVSNTVWGPIGYYPLNGIVLKSTDAAAWGQPLQSFGPQPITDVTFGNGMWLARDGLGNAWSSRDAQAWLQVFDATKQFSDTSPGPLIESYRDVSPLAPNELLGDLCFIDCLSQFAAIGGTSFGQGQMNVSSDGRQWRKLFSVTADAQGLVIDQSNIRRALCLDTAWVLLADNDILTKSRDQSWNQLASHSPEMRSSRRFRGLAASPTRMVVVGEGDTIVIADRKSNLRPTLATVADQTIETGKVDTRIPLSVTDAETPLDKLRIEVLGIPEIAIGTRFVPFAAVWGEFNGTNWNLLIQPRGAYGAYPVTVKVWDEGFLSAESTFLLAVVPSVSLQTVIQPSNRYGFGTNQIAAAGEDIAFYSLCNAEQDVCGQLRRQWQFEGVDIPGATSSTLLLTNVAPSQTGNYRVVLKTGSANPWSHAIDLEVIGDSMRRLSLTLQRSGAATLNLNVPVGVRVGIEASADLRRWQTISNATAAESTMTVNEAAPRGQSARFYRARYSLP